MNRTATFVLLLAATACGSAPKPAAAPPAPAPAPSPAPPPATPAASEADLIIPIEADDAAWGSRTAPVTVVELADIQCPFCARAWATVKELEQEYGPDKLRVVYKHLPLPFHTHAREAAEAAAGVRALGGDAAFWGFLDRAYAAQGELGPDSYAKWAAAVGVDAAALRRGLGSHTWGGEVDRDVQLAGRFGLTGTPTFLVNGMLIDGAQPRAAFEKVIDAEAKKAADLAAKGTPADRVYAVASEANVKAQVAAAAEEEKPDEHVYKVPVGKSPATGAKDALVTVVEFSDFQCPYCKHVEETLKEVRAKYGKDVRFVWKNEPLAFHKLARPAAELALEARAQKGDTGFWAAHDALFAASPKLEDADLMGIARDLGLDAGRTRTALDAKRHERVIEDDEALADDFAAGGTPHFFINGRRLAGAQPLEAFTAIIDAELAKARALVAGGVKPEAVYEAAVREGVTPPGPEKKAIAPSPKAPSRGAPKARVTIDEFSDFQCPYCKRGESVVDEVIKQYGTKVRVVWRNLPLPMHADAELAAEAAMEAQAQKGDAAFWKMHDLLFAAQGTDGGLKREALDGYARSLGLDMTKWAAALDARAHKDAIAADGEAARAAGVDGTPAFFVNGYEIDGAQPLTKFRRLIERALAEAGAK